MTHRTSMLAAAAGALFLAASPSIAQPREGEGASEAKIKCEGANSCKGHNDCRSAHNQCAGKSSCKGMGFKMMSPEECKAHKDKMDKEKMEMDG